MPSGADRTPCRCSASTFRLLPCTTYWRWGSWTPPSLTLEQSSPSPGLRRALAEVGLITLTGGGSYITARTFAALLNYAQRPVWVSAFVLRTVSYHPIVQTLASHGLRTTLDASRTYPQRLFTDEQERQYAIEAVRALGHDPAGREEAGRFHSLHYESRPDAP
ncbi:hypothetical protein [Streptomyces sp. NPDC002078]